MTDASTVTDTDLDAYVDNQLDATGRLRVERHLARNPEAAAQVMADLGIRSSLKLAICSKDEHFSADTRETARRLSSSLSDRQMWDTLRRVAAVGLLVSVGWLAHTTMGPSEVNASIHPPAFVEQAIRAHQTTLVRSEMQSQPEVQSYDRDEIRAATAITMPELPADWKVVDVQVFPSEFGPSIEAAVTTGEGTRVSLFAGRPGGFAVESVKNMNFSDAEAAWWQLGEVAYAVVSSTPDVGLTDEAETLKNSLY
ncbi:Transmembrane transcriptional regulator (anti-sigma factor RsiW) [Rhizobium sp. NFR07]|uniref:anti-sigma factor family protein n=1 Tax=Rhizobium sp. NFR07 TaxID=1566262 RepID=UPI0008E493B0|nr:anti-sigma factor [Rhizobium sp. NFR07]SFB59271.1 Transmembrane transcriptional regulator (anti-sigma factor RsiW) [Rhizobium sp. NFR07]